MKNKKKESLSSAFDEKREFSSEIWKRILLYLYRNEINWSFYAKGTTGIDTEHPLIKRLDITPHQFNSNFDFLTKQGLMEIEQGSSKSFIITKKGFEVVFELEKHIENKKILSKQNDFNRVVALTGSIIAFTSLWSFYFLIDEKYIGKLLTLSEVFSYFLMIVFIFILIILLSFEIGKTYFGKN